MKKIEKIQLVDRLAKEIQDTKGVVLVNYAGLGVKLQQELKSQLKGANAQMVVVKNTLLKLAGKSASINEKILSDDVLSGQTAIIMCDDDPIAPLQVLGKFAKEHEIPKFKVGIIDSTFYDSASLSQLSSLPNRDILMGQLLGSLTSNLYSLVRILNSPMQNLVYTLKNGSGVKNNG